MADPWRIEMKEWDGRGVVRVVSSALVVGTLLLTGIQPANSDNWSYERAVVRASRIDLDSNHLLTAWLMRAFIATGSDSPNCLVTLAEMGGGSGLVFPGPVFCAPRTFEGRKGVMVSVFFPNSDAFDMSISMTLYHQGARFYGTPVPYTGL
jgi:hypothetical protein